MLELLPAPLRSVLNQNPIDRHAPNTQRPSCSRDATVLFDEFKHALTIESD
ncbi:MAG: hypothetical protein R3D57_02675 [Hyphomicrobiaceae bacterium]